MTDYVELCLAICLGSLEVRRVVLLLCGGRLRELVSIASPVLYMQDPRKYTNEIHGLGGILFTYPEKY